ncbi:MAG: hypothetical protein RLY97_127 [Pseudomonadota bacterium]
MQIDIARDARNDLDDIADYISRDNPDRAESFIEELIQSMELIGERPLSYRERSEWQAGLRSAAYTHYQRLRVIGF